MAKLKNPFLLIGFHSKEYFCDRKEELAILQDHFANDRNIVLYSWRRIGKTALIKYFIDTLEEQQEAETLYVELLGTKSTSAALEQITEAVYEKFGKTKSGFSAAFQRVLGKVGMSMSFDANTGLPSFSFSAGSSPKPESSLKALGEFLNNRKKQIVVVLDEFQKVTDYSDQDGEAVFRSWMQSFPEIRFIFSGSHRHMMSSMFLEKNRPFYRSAQLLQLEPIDFEEYKSFILHHFQKNNKLITEKQINELYQWSRGQTYCVQLICNKLFGSYEKVTAQNLSAVYREIITQEASILSNYTNLLTDTQWKVLKAVAKNEPVANPHSQEFISSSNLGASSSVGTALTMLVKKEIVIKDHDGYKVHDVIFTRWLQSL